MRISTQEFLLGSLNDMLTQQSNANRLNREIASGQTLLDAGDDPAGAGQVLALSNGISQLTVDTANAQAAQQTAQTGISALQQVSTIISQLQQIASQAGNAATTPDQRSALAGEAQSALQQLVQLGNTQGAGGAYIFAGSQTGNPAFQQQTDGTVTFAGDDAATQVQIAPSLSVSATLSGRDVFLNIPAGTGGVTVAVDTANAGDAYAVAQGVASISQVAAEGRAGTEFAVSFADASNGTLTYTVTSGSGDPASTGFAATSGVVASGPFTAGSDLQFGGIDLRVVGTPSAGDGFVVQTGQHASLFQTAQDLVNALGAAPNSAAPSSQAEQQVENVLANLGGAQSRILSAQATLGATLSEVQGVQQQNSTQSTNAQAQASNLQSANLPQVIASYSESVTALQAAQLAFARIQNLSLFAVLGP
ncbi:MAG TPA: flagellar hook-associated protein FlgL [Stellaceae bacterium]|jgi:flagellar hook-associated protein 3 FlgL|nr:flagellar hook-associated protein FlgL [Stellaceae bacterium]